MTESEYWACRVCKSINSRRSNRCYSCHTPREAAEIKPQDMPTVGAMPPVVHTGTYRPTEMRAVVVTLASVVFIMGTFVGTYLLWQVGSIMEAFGISAELAAQGQTFLRAYMWCTAPWLLFQLMRNFVSALERPRVVFWLSLGGIGLNALLSWALIFGHFGLPSLGLVGGGLGSTLTWLIMCGAWT